VQHTAPVRQ